MLPRRPGSTQCGGGECGGGEFVETVCTCPADVEDDASLSLGSKKDIVFFNSSSNTFFNVYCLACKPATGLGDGERLPQGAVEGAAHRLALVGDFLPVTT